jgi:hypothetical protein
MMREKIPSNVIIKTSYLYTKNLLSLRYFNSIIDQIMQYIREHPNNYGNLEIEAKLGRFDFKGEGLKVLEKIKETFIIPESIKSTPTNKFIFNAGIPQKDFFLIWSALDKESKLNGSQIECIKPQTYKDEIYNTIYKTNKRRSFIYQDGQLIKEEIIRKENKKNINVRNGGYDFRITCSEEMPTEIDKDNDTLEKERDKFRISYQLSYYRVDLTISKESNNNDYGYEVEIELNKLKSELDKVKKIDEYKIRAILDRFIQNIMNLYSVLLPEAILNNSRHEENLNYELGLNKHLSPQEIESRYGNYFKNNLQRKEK